jgi:hypothetical protein
MHHLHGETDIRRQALNVARMKMLGATVIPVTSGSRTLKDAINETFRDWVANVETTHYIFGTIAGPHPFPAMIRDFQRVIGVEARRQILERAGRLPDAAIACVGGDLTPSACSTRSSRTPMYASSGARPPGMACRPGSTPQRCRPASPASCTARAPTCCRTMRARSPSPGRSRPGSTTRASDRSTHTATGAATVAELTAELSLATRRHAD